MYGATGESPGQLFAVDDINSKYTDVFQPYMLEDFDTDNGTLFRFPLRWDMPEFNREATHDAV